MRSQLKLLFVVVCSLPLILISSDGASQAPAEAAGIKITVGFGSAGISGEQTIYVRGDRRRMEYRNATGGAEHVRYGPHIASITRCDLGQVFELNLDAREYHAAPYPPKPLSNEQGEALKIKPPSNLPSEPTLLIETATVDTGERKEIFGHTARHIITTRKQTPLEGSQFQRQESVMDGWYMDLDNRISCDQKWREGAHAYLQSRASTDSRPPDRPKFVDTGKPETGFALEWKTTTRDTYRLPDGTKKENTLTSEGLVTQLEEGPLDPGVFEIPAGFREVAHIETNPPVDWQTARNNAWQRLKAWVAKVFDRPWSALFPKVACFHRADAVRAA